MTQSDPFLNVEGVLTRRDQYLRQLVLRNGTVADAENINEVQARVEEALRSFGGDVDFSLDQFTLLLSAFTSTLRRDQAAYQAELERRFAALERRVEAELRSIREEFARGDAETLAAAKRYTDEATAEQKELMRENTKTSLGVTTPELADSGLLSGGDDFPIIVGTVPVGHTFEVHRWTYSHRTISGIGGLPDRLRVTWPGFLGYEDFGSSIASAQRDSGAFAKTPIATLPAGTVVRATVYVGNIKTQCTFTLEGFMVPDGLKESA